jgi:hypothetical protein
MDIDESNSFPGMLKFGKPLSDKPKIKEERKGSAKPRTYLDRCKEVGRVGPRTTKLDPQTANGTVKIFDESTSCCDVEGVSQFSSIRANTAVFKGRYYFEVRIMTAGLMQIGWCTLATPFIADKGVGDDETSYAYDGFRVKKWNQDS